MTIRPVAFMPMRHESERVIGKNYRDFNGRPLFHHVLGELCRVDRLSSIVVDTDSPTVRDQIGEHFPTVTCIERSPDLLGGDTPMTDILRYDAERFPNEWYLQTHSTNPLLRAATIEAAIAALEQNLETNDSLFSVTPLQTRLYDADGRAVNHDPSVLLRTQDLPPLYEENSNIYLFTDEQIRSGRRIGTTPLLFPMDDIEALDIDTEADFAIAEAAHVVRHGKGVRA